MDARESDFTWGHDIRQLGPSVERLEVALGQLARWASDELVSRDCLTVDGGYPEPFATLFKRLSQGVEEVRRRAAAIEERYADPILRALQNWHLTEEQFHIVRAAGLDMLELLEFPSSIELPRDYRTLELLYCKGDRLGGYINVQKRQGESRFGAHAEYCERRRLRPEQLEFFRSYFPDVYARLCE